MSTKHPTKTGYVLTTYELKDGSLIFNYVENKKNKVLKVKVSPTVVELMGNRKVPYLKVSNAHAIDKIGVSVYQPRLYRPFTPFPEGQRKCLQWEFDKFLFENPDPRGKSINEYLWEAYNR